MTFPLLTVPLPPVTVHVCVGEDGWVVTVTEYVLPAATGFANVTAPLALTDSGSVPLLDRIRPVPERPETVAPTV